jgi:hypothetical protein
MPEAVIVQPPAADRACQQRIARRRAPDDLAAFAVRSALDQSAELDGGWWT